MSDSSTVIDPKEAASLTEARHVEVDPHLFVIFGATGDLTSRKLLPALYHLMQREDVAEQCFVLGAARTKLSDEDFREEAREALAEQGFSDEQLADWCGHNLFYQCLGEAGDDMDALGGRIHQLEDEYDLPGNRAFYLSLPPSIYGSVTEALGEAGLNESPGWTRLVIEKPFGFDLASARELNDTVHQHFEEDQIYRIDHYLGKETVQNLLVFRFANALFESVWNREMIDRVEITVAEDLGVGSRAGYFDQSGTLRDMVQNHLTQLLSLVAMEPPASFEADAIRQEKVKVLKAVEPIAAEDVVLGQYARGTVDGEAVQGYRAAEGVPADSDTETYAALRLEVGNWRWKDVPFYLRTGKRLPVKSTQIAIRFTRAPVALFGHPENGDEVSPNVLVIKLQPDEGFELQFDVKAPDEPMHVRTQELSFSYETTFGPMPDAYETLLFDIITGDQTLFVRSDEVETSWELYTPLIESDLPVHPYPAGSWGPDEANNLLTDWTNPSVG